MSHVDTPYAQGTPCWVDMMATDKQAAVDFYTSLFGWTAETAPEAGGYTMCLKAGRPVAGIGQTMSDGDQPAQPSAWTTYLASDDADATAAKITAAGGKVLMPPMDVMTMGRMFMAVDPAGAMFGVWQGKDFAGAQTVNEPSSLCWNELNTRDVDGAAKFLTAALGIQAEAMDEMPGYHGLHVGGRVVGGLQSVSSEKFPAGTPAHWLSFFAVDDTVSTVDAHVKAGGTVLMPTFDTPQGPMAVLADPQSAVFAVVQVVEAEQQQS
jgi:uncharacterized protein